MKTILLATAVLFVPLAASAQTPTGITTPVGHRSSALVGANVVHNSETIGKVSEFIINDNGCIDYLVVSYGGGFIPVPWSAAQVNYELRGVTFRNPNISRVSLQGLVFTTTWPNFSDPVVLQQLRDVWGTAAVPNTTPTPDLREGALPIQPVRPGEAVPVPTGPGTPSVAPTRNETGVPRTTPTPAVPAVPSSPPPPPR